MQYTGPSWTILSPLNPGRFRHICLNFLELSGPISIVQEIGNNAKHLNIKITKKQAERGWNSDQNPPRIHLRRTTKWPLSLSYDGHHNMLQWCFMQHDHECAIKELYSRKSAYTDKKNPTNYCLDAKIALWCLPLLWQYTHEIHGKAISTLPYGACEASTITDTVILLAQFPENWKKSNQR